MKNVGLSNNAAAFMTLLVHPRYFCVPIFQDHYVEILSRYNVNFTLLSGRFSRFFHIKILYAFGEAKLCIVSIECYICE